MGGVPLLLAMATLGVDYGWQPHPAGGVEYIVQIPPDQLEQLQRLGGDISSTVDPSIRGRIQRVVIRVGEGDLPHDAGPPPADDEIPANGATPPRSVPGDDAGGAGSATDMAATDHPDHMPLSIPSLEATDRLAMNNRGTGASESVMRPAGDEAAAAPGTGGPTSGASGFNFPASSPAAGGAATDSSSPPTSTIPPFTGGSTDAANGGGTSSTNRDTRWSTTLRTGGPSTDPRPAPSTDPRATTDPRTSSAAATDPRTNPRVENPWPAATTGTTGGSVAGSDGRAPAPTGSGGFGAPPAGYADGFGSVSGTTPNNNYPNNSYPNNNYPNNNYGTPAGPNSPADYRGTTTGGGQPTTQDVRAPYAADGYAPQGDAYRGWDTGNGGYRGPQHAAPQQPAGVDGRSPAGYAAAPYPGQGYRTDGGQPAAFTPPTTALAQVATTATPPVTTPAPAASPADAGPAPVADGRAATTGATPRASRADRQIEIDRGYDEPLAFQKVFNGMLLISLVANAYLLITLSRLLQRYRNIVANARTAAPHPSPAS